MEVGTLLIDEQFLQAAASLISNARKSICITTFKAELTSRPRGRVLLKLFEQVFEKSRSGVDVRFILNRVQKRGAVPVSNLYAMQEIPKHGVKLRCLRDGRVCHAKILIVDDAAAIIGSHNLSVKSCRNNFEVSYEIRNRYIVELLQKVFDRVWDNAEVISNGHAGV